MFGTNETIVKRIINTVIQLIVIFFDPDIDIICFCVSQSDEEYYIVGSEPLSHIDTEDNLPGELRDAAVIDGCDNVRLFFQIVLPLSKAMIAVIALYYAVMHWNTFFSALIYLSDMKKYPLQMFLRDILIQNEQQATLFDGDPELANVKLRLAELVKYCIIIVGSIPVIIAYPFVQKYFVKGVMIGAVKG